MPAKSGLKTGDNSTRGCHLETLGGVGNTPGRAIAYAASTGSLALRCFRGTGQARPLRCFPYRFRRERTEQARHQEKTGGCRPER